MATTDTADRTARAQARLEAILAKLAEGATVWVCTCTHATPLTAKTLARFERAGAKLLKVAADGHLSMARGRGWVSIELATIRVEG